MTLRSRTVSAIAVAAIALIVAIATVHGQQDPSRGPGGPGRGFRPDGPFPVLRQLSLTDAQKDQIKTLVGEARGTTDQAAGGRAQKLAALHRDLHAAIFADTPDPAQIEQLRTALAEAQSAALAARIDLETKIAQVLTPEQRKQARELAAARPRRPGRMGL
jgi:Spy/CpxP family protein refolding chaperone